jgi:long-subunit fatty acid transport protein
MARFRYILLAAGLMLLIGGVANAGSSPSKAGTSGAQFLKLGVGARYAAMGEASVAVVNDGYALYWNPAAMGDATKSYLEFTNINWVGDINLNYVAYVRPTAIGTIGVSAGMLTSGDMEITTVDQPDGTGRTFSTSSYALTVGYARQMTDFFSFGMNFKYIAERISEEHARGIAFDLGTMLRPGYRNLRIGMNISNLGPQLKFGGSELNFRYNPSPDNPNYDKTKGVLSVDSYELPLVFRIGAAYDLQYGKSTRITLAVEAHDPSDNYQQGAVGTELAFSETLFLRGGYKINYEEEDFTFGAGLNLNVWQHTDLNVNYAWSDFGRLASVQRISVGFRF